MGRARDKKEGKMDKAAYRLANKNREKERKTEEGRWSDDITTYMGTT